MQPFTGTLLCVIFAFTYRKSYVNCFIPFCLETKNVKLRVTSFPSPNILICVRFIDVLAASLLSL